MYNTHSSALAVYRKLNVLVLSPKNLSRGERFKEIVGTEKYFYLRKDFFNLIPLVLSHDKDLQMYTDFNILILSSVARS